MQYVIPAGTAAHIQSTVGQYNNWRPYRTTKLLRFDTYHDALDAWLIFLKGNWKLGVRESLVWLVEVELIMGRTDQRLFLVEGIVRLTDQHGKVRRTITPANEDYKEYMDILRRGAGKDPHDYRT